MGINLRNARDFVYQHGALWEKALFSHLFENGSLERVHQCLLCHKNPDGGWAHGIEHDLKAPVSNAGSLEFLLRVLVETEIPIGNLLDGSPEWVEQHRKEDGSLLNPPEMYEYPHMPWWGPEQLAGQTTPDSIVGNLKKLGKSTPSLEESTRKWVLANITPESIKANEWLFMAYHYYDYFMNVSDFPDVERYRQAVIENILTLAEKAPPKQYHVLFTFAPSPDSPVAKAIAPVILERNLNHVVNGQQEDGQWLDEHDLLRWQSWNTIMALLTLRRYGRF